jgi:uncharacterized protein (DUF4415 family)
LTAERVKRIVAKAPSKVIDPETPYDPNDAKSVSQFWKGAVLTRGGGVRAVTDALAARRRPGQRGPGKRPPKVSINIRLSPEVLEAFKASGDGWQTRVDGALRDWLKTHSPASSEA